MSTNLPLVSIVTPTLNQGMFLEEAICSVLRQDYPHIEYIVIDGGSTDRSLEILQRYTPRLAYWESTPDHGQAHAINKGLQRARGEILGWLNADDLLLPETVRNCVHFFLEHEEVDVVYGHIERINESGQLVPTPKLPKDQVAFNAKLVLGECVVNQPGAFWRRSIMEKAGLLDESLRFVMDYEYWIRLALCGARFYRLPQTVAYFRLSRGSKTVTQSALMALEHLTVLERTLHIENLPSITGLSMAELRVQERKTRSAVCLHAFYGYLKSRHFLQAGRWFIRAMQADWRVLFQRRWFGLAWASILRRLLSFRGLL